LNGYQRRAVYLFLLQNSNHSKKLPNGIAQQAAAKFGIGSRVVTRIWTIGKNVEQEGQEAILNSLSPRRKGKCGRKKKS
jgi:hypothetical protein